jgi:hypothetical protein
MAARNVKCMSLIAHAFCPEDYLSADRVVVPRGVFLGPAFLLWLVFAPRAFRALCLPFTLRPGPPFSSFRPGLSGRCRMRRLGCVPVRLRLFPRSPPCFFAINAPKPRAPCADADVLVSRAHWRAAERAATAESDAGCRWG